jgi:type IV fimbrial biogenesis protein FimT
MTKIKPVHLVRPRSAGFTLVELMVALAIVAIAISLAGPSFDGMFQRSRLASQTADLTSSFAYARSEALKRGVRVTVCKSADPTAAAPVCSAGATWNSGWIIFADNTQIAGNVAGTVDGADQVLRINQALNGAALTVGAAFEHWIAFAPTGAAVGGSGVANGSFQICQGVHGQSITVNVMGRVQSNKVSC